MEFKGMIGKVITVSDTSVILKQKSLMYGRYEKIVPFSKIQRVDIVAPTIGKSGYIRFVEAGDDRIFEGKEANRLIVEDLNTVMFTGSKKTESLEEIKEIISKRKEIIEDSEIVLKYRKKGKLGILILFVICFIVAECNISNIHKKTFAEKERNIPTYERFGFNEDDFKEIQNVFDKCELPRITKVEKEDVLDNGDTSYYVELEGVEPNKVISTGVSEGNIIYVYITKNKTVSEIGVNFSPIYKNGKVLNKFNAFTKLSSEERIKARNFCEEQLKQFLKYPDSAKFCDNYKWSKENGIIKAQGYVESKNELGLMVRTDYLLTYDCVTNKALTLNVDGKMYKYK